MEAIVGGRCASMESENCRLLGNLISLVPDVEYVVRAFLGVGWISTEVTWIVDMIKYFNVSKNHQPSKGLCEVPPFLSSRPASEHLKIAC